MKKIILMCLGLLVFTFASLTDAQASIFIDGNLTDDWGVTPGKCGFTNWEPTNGALCTSPEDQKGGLGTYLGPGYGGQKFDAEAMYYKREAGKIYLAIVTGHPAGGASDTAGHMYYPGDIAIDFNGDNIFEYGIKTTGSNKGTLYGGLTLDSWNKGLSNWGGTTDPTTIKNGQGSIMGNPFEFVYNNTYYWDPASINDNQHYVMEMGIPEDYFGSDWMNGGTIHWTQTCGNDALDLYIPKTTPEPATVSLLGLGLAGLFRFRRKKS